MHPELKTWLRHQLYSPHTFTKGRHFGTSYFIYWRVHLQDKRKKWGWDEIIRYKTSSINAS